MQPGEKQLVEMQLVEMQHFNTTPLGEMQFGEMQLSQLFEKITLAEWLTRWPAKPFPFGSAGSSPAGDEDFLFTFYLKKSNISLSSYPIRLILTYVVVHDLNFNFKSTSILVTLAEWLTRWPAKPFPFGNAGSSPAGDEELHFTFCLKKPLVLYIAFHLQKYKNKLKKHECDEKLTRLN
ncbi:hypothetical protein H8356DRAFT_1343892 [Neocallimastix lanati (nom. inval.)]|nr:hypothetical protein H8356DRAFT_1343892 [Neocallimastix sp. JGI-2020a]